MKSDLAHNAAMPEVTLRRRMGRKPKGAAEKMEARMQFTLTTDQRAALERWMGIECMTIESEAVRKMVLERLRADGFIK